MADIYRAAMDDHIAMMDAHRAKGTGGTYAVQERQQQIGESVYYLRQHLHEVPVLLVPTVEGRLDDVRSSTKRAAGGRSSRPCGTSCSPCACTVSAAHGRRSTSTARPRWPSCCTSRHRRVTQAGLFPIAYTLGTDFRAANRASPTTTIRWNRWE